MTRVLVLALVAVLLQPLQAGAQAPAGPYPILFVHGFCSIADTWTVMTTALQAASPARFGTTVTALAARVVFPGQEAVFDERAAELAFTMPPVQ